MNRDDIIRMAGEAGMVVVDDQFNLLPFLERFFNMAQAAMIEQGWRQCAKDQRTTQFCGMVEQAIKEEREACAKDLDELSEAAKDLYAKGFVWKAIKESAAVIRARGNQ